MLTVTPYSFKSYSNTPVANNRIQACPCPRPKVAETSFTGNPIAKFFADRAAKKAAVIAESLKAREDLINRLLTKFDDSFWKYKVEAIENPSFSVGRRSKASEVKMPLTSILGKKQEFAFHHFDNQKLVNEQAHKFNKGKLTVETFYTDETGKYKVVSENMKDAYSTLEKYLPKASESLDFLAKYAT